MKPVVSLGVRLAVAVGALAVLFHFVPASAVVATVADMHPGYLAAGMVLQFLLRAVNAVRMKVIADGQGIRMTVATTWRILLSTQFYSMLLPGPVAGGGATWLKYVQHGADGNAAAATILLNRGIGFLVMILAGATAWVLDGGRGSTWVLAAVIIASALALIAANRPWLAESMDAAAGASPRSMSWLRRRATELGRRLLLFGRLPAGGRVAVLASSALHEVAGAAVMWCFAMAVGLELALVTVLWMRAALQVVLLLPLSIGGLGLREAGLVGLSAIIDVPAATAVTWSLTLFLGTLVVAAAGGLIEAGAASSRLLRSFAGGPPPQGPPTDRGPAD
jgi:glycosyltransferase 2 family protein